MAMTVPAWVEDAACHGADPGMFFPDKSEAHAIRAVIQVYCDDCPVREACLDLGLHMEYGVWGGLTAHERRRLRRSGTPAR